MFNDVIVEDAMNRCTQCHRHVREVVCPFCEGRAMPFGTNDSTHGAIVRGAVIVVTALAATAVVAPGDAHADDGRARIPDSAAVAAYGVAPPAPVIAPPQPNSASRAPIDPPHNPPARRPHTTHPSSSPPPSRTPHAPSHASTHHGNDSQHGHPQSHHPDTAPASAYGIAPPRE